MEPRPAQKGALAANGQLPVYVNLYRGKGSWFGWLTFTNTATNDIPGLLLWTKKDGVAGYVHPGPPRRLHQRSVDARLALHTARQRNRRRRLQQLGGDP
jgi:hypothetical protein